MNHLEKVAQQIYLNKSFIITSHVNPDGDSLGCELALARFLKKLNKNVYIINHNETPKFYEFLDKNNEIQKFIPEKHTKLINNSDVIFILDTNQPDRLRSLEEPVIKSPAVKIVIDHHLEAHNFANYYLIDEQATSTAEILYKLLVYMNNNLLDYDIAHPLYTAIMTDTGSFRFPRTDVETHQIIAHLLHYGVDPTEVYSKVYETWTPNRIQLLAKSLSTLKLEYDGKLAYIICTIQMFESTNTTEVETDNFTNYPMSIEGVQIGLLFNELDDGVKISLRSRGDIPINELAKELGGGGHKNAAGARLFNAKLDDAITITINNAKKYIK